jgi:very-short-patch-repair endonuclease
LDANQKDYDEVRENILNTYDIKIIRFTNEQVFNNLINIKEYLIEYL